MVDKIRVSKGFTLMELMVAVIILGVLAAVAIPAYNNYLEDGRIAQGRSVILQNAQFMERWYTDKGTYVGATNIPYTSEFFTFAVTSSTDSTYKIQATPIANKNPSTDYLLTEQDGSVRQCVVGGSCTAL